MFVIITHVFSYEFNINYQNYSIYTQLFLNTLFCISKIAVPVFVMITGGLILRKDYSVESLYKKSIKIGTLIIVWSLIYIIFHMIWGGQKYTILEIVNGILNCEIRGHLWYLYMLLWLYLMIPFVRLIIPFIENNFLYYKTLLRIGTIIPLIILILSSIFKINIRVYIDMPLIVWTFVYLILGYFIVNKMKFTTKSIKKCIIIFITSNIFTILLTHINIMMNKTNNEIYLNNIYINTVLSAVSFFIIIKEAYIHINHIITKILTKIGQLSLIIYLVHPIFIDIVRKYINKFYFMGNISLYKRLIIEVGIVFILSLAFSYIISKCKHLKKVLSI